MNHKAGDAERALEKMSPFQLKEEEYSIWDRFVDQQKEGTIYHLSSWKGFLEETFPHIKGTLIAVRDMNSGDIVAGIPLYTVRSVLLGHRVVSTPFATLGGILGSSDREVGNLCATILEIGSRWGGGRLEIRGVRDLRKTEGFPLFPSKKFLHHYLELPDTTEELLSKFSRVVRRNLIKAEKAGVRVHDDNSAEILRKFSLMHQMERKRL